jgi:hypothetical protein
MIGYKIISSESGYDEKGNYVLEEIMVEIEIDEY